ncbi:hypothetical protein FRB94_004750 [Tulasnella sp. JGI-2019a]|nr:hypothetical protein FRB93_011406 [Tulasnella sp. JGI-2019a]KAG9012940.1 hypothetical protein FRB94_004750 [Tulasnella sp. JGI-2019a]KAG9036692.1 hypothetical protein FRB95_008276 [Tulasnella sp. JGI-2019a]
MAYVARLKALVQHLLPNGRMDPLEPSSFHQRDIKLANGRQYHICDEQPHGYQHGTTPVLLLIHGFPEFWYEWRYQIGPFVRRGWRVIVPDTLGYGQTDKPDDRSLYTPLATAAEMASLLDALDVKQPVVIVGHDWGSAAAWAFATRYRERARALVTLSIPYVPPLNQQQTVSSTVTSNPNLFGYWQYFTSPEGPKEIQANLPRFFDAMYRSNKTQVNFTSLGACKKLMKGETKIAGPTDVMSERERAFYIDTFERGGIDAPINYYRSADCRYEQEQALKLNPVLPTSMPILFIATKEPFCTPKRIEATRPFVPSMEVARLTSNHFVMLEKRDEITQIIGDWVENKLKATSA